MSRGALGFLALLALGTAGPLAYVAGRPSVGPARAGELRVGVLALDRSSWSLQRLGIGESLVSVGFDAATEPEPGLARSWQRIEPCRWRFTLREDVRFHDGSRLDADAVVRVLRGYFDEHWGGEAPVVDLAVAKVDPMRLDIVTPRPGHSAPGLVGRLLVFTPSSFTKGAFSNCPVGTGPWKVESLRYGDRIVLARNADYWGGAPQLERLVVRQVAEHQTRVLALESGDLDWSQMVLRQDISRLEADGYPVVRSDFLYDVFLHFNTQKQPVDDPRVRQAISFAIDRRAIAAGPFEGTADAASTLFPEGVGWFAADQRSYNYEPERARALLEDAGWRLAGDARTRARNGEELVLPLLARGNRPAHMQAGEIIQRQLGEVGIRCDYEVVEFGAWEARVHDRGDFVVTLDGRLPNWIADPVAFVRNEFTSMGASHVCRLRDARLDALVRRAVGEAEDRRRTALVREMQLILSEALPWVILVHDRGRETFATAKGLSGVDTPFPKRYAFPGPRTRWKAQED